ncbi:hypothetical protein BDK51DRAFT_40866, partial [Blyttiomyces helicus]
SLLPQTAFASIPLVRHPPKIAVNLLAALGAANFIRHTVPAYSYVPIPSDDDAAEETVASSLDQATSGRVHAVDAIAVSLNTAALVLAVDGAVYWKTSGARSELLAVSDPPFTISIRTQFITLRLSVTTARAFPAPPASLTSKLTFWVFVSPSLATVLSPSCSPWPTRYPLPGMPRLPSLVSSYSSRLTSCTGWTAMRSLEASDLMDLAEPDTEDIAALHYDRK